MKNENLYFELIQRLNNINKKLDNVKTFKEPKSEIYEIEIQKVNKEIDTYLIELSDEMESLVMAEKLMLDKTNESVVISKNDIKIVSIVKENVSFNLESIKNY